MDPIATKNIVEAALLVARQPLTLDKLLNLFSSKGVEADRAAVRQALSDLSAEYESRGIGARIRCTDGLNRPRGGGVEPSGIAPNSG